MVSSVTDLDLVPMFTPLGRPDQVPVFHADTLRA